MQILYMPLMCTGKEGCRRNMLKDVTIGQYYSVDSVIHRLDSRLKIRFTLIYTILLLIDRNLFLFLVLTGVYLLAFYLSRVPVSHMLRGTRSILLVVLICSAINIFTTSGEVLVKWGAVQITEAGIVKCGFVFWRMVLIIFMSSVMMYTTTPTELTDGLEKCFHLSGNIAMGITIALRFVSVLFEELDRIMKAQEARGADFHSGGPVKRLRSLRTVLVPLFRNSIERAGRLGDAMDARCYTGGKGRTKLNPLVYDLRDFVGYMILIALIVASIWLALRF